MKSLENLGDTPRTLDIIVPTVYPENPIKTIGRIVSKGFAASPIPIIADNHERLGKVQYYVILCQALMHCSRPSN